VLRATGALTLSLVATEAGGIVGHIAFSAMTVAVNPRGLRVLGLGLIAVSPARQRRGIGLALICHGLDAARAQGAGAVILLSRAD